MSVRLFFSDVYKFFANSAHTSQPLCTPFSKNKKKCMKMNHILDDDLLNIFERLAISNVKNFLRFRETSSRHWRLSKTHKVLRIPPRNWLSLLTDSSSCVGKRILIQRLSDSGNLEFCVARATQLLHGRYFDLKEVKQILLRSKSYGFIEEKYFLMTLDALASGGFSPENAFPVFRDLFERKQISYCRRALMWVLGYYSSRPLPRELDYRFMCRSYKTCKGSGRKPNVFSQPPGSNDDYFMIDIFLLCRFDAEILWFLTHFRFSGTF